MKKQLMSRLDSLPEESKLVMFQNFQLNGFLAIIHSQVVSMISNFE